MEFMTGVEMIATERKRQIEEEGFDTKHDEENIDGELALAAACYAAPEPVFVKQQVNPLDIRFRDAWPWSWGIEWDKRFKHDRLRSLVIAGALIAAEIERRYKPTEVELTEAREEDMEESWP